MGSKEGEKGVDSVGFLAWAMGDRNRTGFGLGHVGFKMPGEYTHGEVPRRQLNAQLWSTGGRHK